MQLRLDYELWLGFWLSDQDQWGPLCYRYNDCCKGQFFTRETRSDFVGVLSDNDDDGRARLTVKGPTGYANKKIMSYHHQWSVVTANQHESTYYVWPFLKSDKDGVKECSVSRCVSVDHDSD